MVIQILATGFFIGKIVHVGQNPKPDLVDYSYVDMDGSFILPGLQDAHLHLFHLGEV